MSKVKYKAPTQATSKFIWNGFQILPGYIYGRDALGLYVIENAYKNDIETHSKSFKMYRRMPGKDNARYNNWVYVAANTNSDKTLAQIVRIASKGDIYLKDYMRNDVFYAMKPRYYKTVNGKIAHFYGTKELPQTSHSECLTTHRCKVSKGYNTSNMHCKSPEYLLHSYKLYGTKSIYGNHSGLEKWEMDYLDGAII